MKRRDFVKGAGAIGIGSLISHPHLFLNYAYGSTPAFQDLTRLSYRAHRPVEFEGAWTPSEMEGEWPKNLNGVLYRNGSGQKNVFATNLHHFFDGDAYVSAIRMSNGKLQGLSKFIATPERQAELSAKRMRYHDFGTTCPTRSEGFKNPPSISLAAIGENLYSLSEGAHPVRIDAETLECLGADDFQGSLPSNVTFTAHPKKDPVNGDWFAYGITKGLSPELKVFKLAAGQNRFQSVGGFSLGGFYPVHDFMMTKNYLIFVVPPVYISLWGLMGGNSCIADNIVAEPTKPLRIFVLRKDGKGSVQTFKSSPSSMIFHHANAVESEDGKSIRFWSMDIEDASIFESFKHFTEQNLPPGPKSWITEFSLDLSTHDVTRKRLSDGVPTDFPCIDQRTLGQSMDRIYHIEVRGGVDEMAFNSLAMFDVNKGPQIRVAAEPTQMLGEPIFASTSNEDFLLVLGYDDTRDESFLDVRSAEDLSLRARAWLSVRIPLGFHGLFV